MYVSYNGEMSKQPTPLQRAMTAHGSLTDTELAARTGWTSQTINRVRHGKLRPSRPLALALERELAPHLSAEELLGFVRNVNSAAEAAQ